MEKRNNPNQSTCSPSVSSFLLFLLPSSICSLFNGASKLRPSVPTCASAHPNQLISTNQTTNSPTLKSTNFASISPSQTVSLFSSSQSIITSLLFPKHYHLALPFFSISSPIILGFLLFHPLFFRLFSFLNFIHSIFLLFFNSHYFWRIFHQYPLINLFA